MVLAAGDTDQRGTGRTRPENVSSSVVTIVDRFRSNTVDAAVAGGARANVRDGPTGRPKIGYRR